MKKPTPPPWFSKHVTMIYLTPDRADEMTVRIISSGPDAEDPVLAYVPITWPEDEANADFIPKACNLYERLIHLIEERLNGIKSEEDWHRRAKEVLAEANATP